MSEQPRRVTELVLRLLDDAQSLTRRIDKGATSEIRRLLKCAGILLAADADDHEPIDCQWCGGTHRDVDSWHECGERIAAQQQPTKE